MQQIQTDNIDELLSLLPVIPFDDSPEFQQLIVSPLFNKIFQYYKEHYSNDKINSKPEIQQRISLYLNITGQSDDFIEQSDQLLYQRYFPTIEEFLEQDRFFGRATVTMFPFWKRVLHKVFSSESAVKKLVLSGATGIGKTWIANLCLIYVLYRALCFRYPKAVYGMAPNTTLAFFILSVTQKTAWQTNIIPIITLLKDSGCFQQVRNMAAFEGFDLANSNCPIPFVIREGDQTVYFPNDFILTMGSQISNTVSYNIIFSSSDELNELKMDEALALLNSIDGRLTGRFQGSDFIFQTVMSSARNTKSPTEAYIKQLPKNDPSILVLRPMRFEVRETADFVGDGKTFSVLVGNGIIPSRIITNPGEIEQIKDEVFEVPNGCVLVDNVPELYRNEFEANLEQKIQDILGMATQEEQLLFRDTSKIIDEQLIPEINIELNLGDNVRIIDLLPEGLFEKDFNGNKRFKRAKNAPRYFSLDLSEGAGNCDTGIVILHKEKYLNPENKELETYYIIDMILHINSKIKLDMEAIKQFPLDLKEECGVVFEAMGSDQFQSILIRQQWEQKKCSKNVEAVSVDKTLEPYTNCSFLVEKGNIKAGKCPILIKELESLVVEKGKVTKTTEKKDAADALAGALWLACKHYKDVPFVEYIPQVNENTDYFSYENFIKNDQELIII